MLIALGLVVTAAVVSPDEGFGGMLCRHVDLFMPTTPAERLPLTARSAKAILRNSSRED